MCAVRLCCVCKCVRESTHFLIYIFFCSSVFRMLLCAYILAAASLHKPIMVSVRHAVATNDDAIIHIAAMPSVSSLRVLLQFFFRFLHHFRAHTQTYFRRLAHFHCLTHRAEPQHTQTHTLLPIEPPNILAELSSFDIIIIIILPARHGVLRRRHFAMCLCVIRCCCCRCQCLVIISLVRFLPFPHEKTFVAYRAFFPFVFVLCTLYAARRRYAVCAYITMFRLYFGHIQWKNISKYNIFRFFRW